MNGNIPMHSEIPKPPKNDKISPWKNNTESKAYFMKDLIFSICTWPIIPFGKCPALIHECIDTGFSIDTYNYHFYVHL